MSEEKSSQQGNQEVVVDTLPKAGPEHALTEGWRDSPIPDRLTAAYQVGRLLNELNWHFQHLLFFVARDHRQYADEVLARLSGLSYKFASDPSTSLDVAIRSVRDDWKGCLRCEEAADEAAKCFDERWLTFEECSSKERRQGLVAIRIRRPLLEKLREAFRKELNEDEKWALDLGDYVDQGLRRADISDFFEEDVRLREPDVPAKAGANRSEEDEKWALELGDCVDQGVRRADISDFFEEDVRLREPDVPAKAGANRSELDGWLIEERCWPVFEPGDLEVDTAWPHRLMALLQKLRIAGVDADIGDFLNDKTGHNRNSRLSLVEKIDNNIREQLSSLNHELTELPIVDISPQSAGITWKGTRYEVSHKWADAFEALIAAAGHPVGLARILHDKPSRAIQKLPKPLRELLERVGNAGYRLRSIS